MYSMYLVLLPQCQPTKTDAPRFRHLLVGLTSRAARISLSPADRAVMAQVFRLQLPWERSAAAAAVAAAAAAAAGEY